MVLEETSSVYIEMNLYVCESEREREREKDKNRADIFKMITLAGLNIIVC